MPNLVVYVPAGLARELDALGVSVADQRRACHAAVRRLAENGGLGPGEVTGSPAPQNREVGMPVSPASPAPKPLPTHRADPKTKASQEHGPKQRSSVKGLCPHRVPVGSYCKRCEEAA